MRHGLLFGKSKGVAVMYSRSASSLQTPVEKAKLAGPGMLAQ